VKIVHVTLRFDAPGGVETTVREVTRRLKARGEDVQVFASDLFDEAGWVRRSDYRPEVDGVPVRRFGLVKRPAPHLTLPMMVGLIDALAESGADVIHAHSHRYGHVLQAAAVARRLRTPIVISTHYHPADRRESAWKRGLLRLEDFTFGLTAYRTASALVAESQVEARRVGEFAPRDRIHVIPPGIDSAEWSSAGEATVDGIDLPERFLLFSGRIASNKGLGLLLEGLARIPPTERLPLVVMGPDWGEQPALESRARALGIAGSIRWVGPAPDRRTYRGVLRRASALVLPSEWEAFGLVLVDAMAAGVPVVATAVGAVPEVLEQGRAGRLVPFGEPEALAAALRAVVGAPEETARLRAEGLRRAAGLDWSVSVEGLLALYRSVAA
jgi:glycosyltransferase involved in cell wall biosynthesis